MKAIESINLFLSQPQIAIIGVSRNKNKFGNAVYRTLKKKGINVVPVNPHLIEFDGDTCYSHIETLPSQVKAVFVNTPPESTIKIVERASGFDPVALGPDQFTDFVKKELQKWPPVFKAAGIKVN